MTEVVLSSPSMIFQSDWLMTGIDQEKPFFFSRKFMHKETELFRARMKMMSAGAGGTLSENHSSKLLQNPAVKLSFLNINLSKMGLKVSSVTSLRHLFDSYRYEVEMEEDPGTQLFNIFETHNKSPDFTLKFTIHLTGSVNKFCLYQIDQLLSKQLWPSIINEETADFKLLASDGNGLPVHKWILAARSPVFAELLRRGEEDFKSIHLAIDCTLDEMNQFVKFIVTGELEGLLTEKLKQLAVKYQIKTLEDLCQSGYCDDIDTGDSSTDDKVEIFYPMDESESRPPVELRNQ